MRGKSHVSILVSLQFLVLVLVTSKSVRFDSEVLEDADMFK